VNTESTRAAVLACVREVAPEADLESLPADADLREALFLDSLDFLRLVELLSERTRQRIDEDDYLYLSSIDSITAFLIRRR
jgi:acyl carrier protein